MRKYGKSALVLAAVGMAPFGSAWSDNFQAEPSAACDFLVQDGLRTRGGYRADGDTYRCRSRRREIISGGAVNNSIRFVAQGSADKVTQLRLELQVNSPSVVQRTHRQLLEYSRSLMMKALGTEMPEEIEAAILSGTQGTWSLNGGTVTLERIVLGGPGYELRLGIR